MGCFILPNKLQRLQGDPKGNGLFNEIIAWLNINSSTQA